MAPGWDVETIVAEVLRRLAAPSAPLSASPAVTPKSAAGPVVAGRVPHGALQLSDHVVSLATLEGQWEGMTGISVTARAVVTPAVRDELRRRGLSLNRRPTTGNNAGTGLELLLATEDSRVNLGQWQQQTGAAETTGPADLDAIAMRLAAWVTPQRIAVLWSTRPTWASCLANRHVVVRAAAVDDLAGVQRAVDSAGANVLVLDSRRSAGAWKRWIESFARGTYRLAPAT